MDRSRPEARAVALRLSFNRCGASRVTATSSVTPDDIFKRVIGALEAARIPYMLTGSFASSYHGAPRATQDIDLVIAPTAEQLRALISGLPRTEYYVDEDAAFEAQRHEGQFNIVDFATGWKVDLIIQKRRPFSREEFARRELADFHGLQVAIATVEDVLLAKLEWANLGQSQRQLEDIATLLKVRSADLDRKYLAHWIGQLGLAAPWEAACRIAGIPIV